MEETNSCKVTAVTNYLNEVLRLTPIPNSTLLIDGKCSAAISHDNRNDGITVQIELCISEYEEFMGAYFKSERSTYEVIIRTTCLVSSSEGFVKTTGQNGILGSVEK